MFKILSLLFDFLKELIYDSKDEYNYMSPKFNVRKAAGIAVILLAFIVAYNSTKRVVVQSVYIVRLKDAILLHREEELERNKEYEDKIAALQSELKESQEKGKKPRTAPSDSRNGAEKTQSPASQLTEKKDTSDKSDSDKNKRLHMTREQETAFFDEFIAKKKF